jgi:NAD-dependent DNA ligase
MVYFFTSLKCLNCKDKTILKIYNAGYKTIESIIQAKVEDISQIEGIGTILATKLLSSIVTNIKEATTHELLAALNSFGEGIGLKKIQNIDLEDPYKQVKGLSTTTLEEKILPFWQASLDRVKNIKTMVGCDDLKTIEENNDFNPLKNRIFVFTGFRDPSLEKQITRLGGKVTSAISKKTTDLIVATTDNVKSSTKLLKAQNLGISITTKAKFIQILAKTTISTVEVDYDHYSSAEEE